MTMLLTLALLSFYPNSVSSLEISGTTVTIHNTSDFIELSNNVNSGITTYSGSTVLLGDDIDFAGYSEDFEPIGIGTSSKNTFKGSFDGQGHTISNLAVNSSLLYVGLFGSISAVNFKNLVIDSSCSLTSTFNFTSEFGIIGWISYFQPTSASTTVSGVVNMGSVTSAMAIDNKTEAFLGVGGVVGCINTGSYGSTVRNCVNYGAITDYGTCMYVAIGGILGALGNTKLIQKNGCTITNCANYGRIVHRGKMSGLLVMGGIAGAPFKSIAKNCINFDIFDTDWVSTAIGKIIGAVDDNSDVYRCLWTNEADNVNNPCGFGYMSNPKITESYFVESNTTTLDLLNSWVSEENEKESEPKYTKWMMLHLSSGGGMNTVREETLIVPQMPFPAPNREGHSFIHWCTDSECTTGEYNGTLGNATDLYAMWKINNYTVTFDYGNGTLVSESLVFNTTIIYPEAPRGEGIYGWNSSIERVPAYDIVIGPNTTPPPKSSKSNVGAIVGGVVGGMIGIAIIVLAVLVITYKKLSSRKSVNNERDPDGYISMTNIYHRVVERINEGNGATFEAGAEPSFETDKYADLYPDEYETPTLPQALAEAGYDRGETQRIMTKCNIVTRNAESKDKLFSGFTTDDAAAVALYTYEFERDTKKNPSNTLNKGLTGDTNNDLRKVRGMLSLVMRALRKLPRCRELTVYRGIKGVVNKDMYNVGNVVVFHGITSMSTNMSTVKDFLTTSDDMGGWEISSGMLFVIEDAWGYDIQPYSVYPNEREILLEPERHFTIKGLIESDVTIVELKMLDTPLILPQIFGYGAESYA